MYYKDGFLQKASPGEETKEGCVLGRLVIVKFYKKVGFLKASPGKEQKKVCARTSA